jgi:phosphatidate cytidylyltransferase
MLGQRLLSGTVMTILAVGIIAFDQSFAPWYPFLLVTYLLLGVLGCFELLRLLPAAVRPIPTLAYVGILALAAANWSAPVHEATPALTPTSPDPWHWVGAAFVGFVVLTFLVEMYRFREPNGAVMRMAAAVWIVAYLGLLPSFFAQLRWLPGDRGTWALALAVFVPKCGDIGAYFTGRFLGRHRMTPLLSPKKTWEGFAGGMAAAVLTAVLLGRAGGIFDSDVEAGLFGLAVGVAGVLGDLAESLVKRDCQVKDAAKSIPGFGGVLDVIDSVLFAAPVAYLWLR